MKKKLVSIILPTYNGAAYLQRSIGSVLQQTYPYWELIVWDDGSTDNTREIVGAYNDPRIKYYYAENRGVYYARNKAIAISSGAYLAFLDSDDEWWEEKLSAQVMVLNVFPQIEILFSDFLNIDVATNKEQRAFDQCADIMKKLDVEQIDDNMLLIKRGIPENLAFSNFIASDSVILRRELFGRWGCFSEELRNWGDTEYFWRMGLNDVHFAYLNKVYVNRYKYPGGLSGHNISTYKNKIKGLNLCFQKAVAKGRKDLIPYLNRSYRDAWQNLMPLFGESGDVKGVLESFLKSFRYGFQLYTFRVLLESINKLISAKSDEGVS